MVDTEHSLFKAAIGEDNKYGVSLKITGRKKMPLQDPWGFMVIDLPFCSHEEFIGFNNKVRKLNIQMALSYFQESNTIH